MFNVVHRARLSPGEADGAIAAVKQRYGEHDLPVLWWVGPSSRPSDLGRRLIAAGFQPAGETVGMALDLETSAATQLPENLEIRPTTDDDSLETFARTMCLGFQMVESALEPSIELALAIGFGTEGPLINYLGYLNGRAVATSTLFLGAGVAGIYNVSTVAGARRRGIGTAMTVAPLLEARKRGYRFAVLTAAAKAQPMYERLGFAAACYFHEYLWPL
jgi:ribosomal protein S18 acetylase RimI-like enzyme